ncbi:MAG: hypothetical protein FJ098_12955 [Deltaproteobacteria bacterium]|nr:hypothetical protein [Deltaproteobacteria bacterium]
MNGNTVQVCMEAPERMNLMGLMMKGLLEAALARPGMGERASGLRGAVRVQAGAMVVVLDFTQAGPRIRGPAEGERYRARVSGAMTPLLRVVTGHLLGPVLSGGVRIGGNPFFLLSVLPLIRAE